MDTNRTTENYIILKPISERFNNIANEITDSEIKDLIKSTIKEQLMYVDFRSTVTNIIEEYLDDNEEEIISMYKESLKDKFK